MSNKAKHKLLLDELEKLNQTSSVSVHIPTIDAVVDFKEITIKQQKNIITSAIDAILTNTVFNNTVNDIVKQNILSDIDINKITTIDRLPIIISLRNQSLGPIVTVKTDNNDYKINITDHVNKFNTFNTNKLKTCATLQDRSISVNVSVPTLKTDSRVNTSAKTIIEQSPGGKYVNSIGQLFVFEIVKYIDSIQANDIKIDFRTTPIPQCIAIVEKLPMSISKKILNFIQKIKQFEEKYLKVSHDNTTTLLSIDATFFNNE